MTDVLPIDIRPADKSHVGEWRQLAAEVQLEFGAEVPASEAWLAKLHAHIVARSAWGAFRPRGGAMVGGMWISQGLELLSIDWLAVRRDQRRSGIGARLVSRALTIAGGRPVRVITFGPDHPLVEAADAARRLYLGLGFEPSGETAPDGPDGTPRAVFVRPAGSPGD